MNWPPTLVAMDALAERFQIAGCALVDPTSGWVWHATGKRPQAPEVWEAAIDYWRLHDRHRGRFEGLGDLAALVLYHRHGALALLPCCNDPPLHMVCLADRGRVDWVAWQRAVRQLGELLSTSPHE